MRNGKSGIILLTLGMIMFFFAFLLYTLGYKKGHEEGLNINPNLFKFEDNVFKTVAHIDLSNKEDVQLVYGDVDKDIAYYMYVGDRPWIHLEDTVYFYDGSSSKIAAMDIYGFMVEDASSVTFGYSGTAVTDDKGNQIGYVSERLPNGLIYCIWI